MVREIPARAFTLEQDTPVAEQYLMKLETPPHPISQKEYI